MDQTKARSNESVVCPECGQPTTPRQLGEWGHCRKCRTADSRAVQPLRW
ncbi:hypothetical protein [Klenkia terrae]|uniref:Uncharacterized protein n=1 Tax=Klenkia terrae TaxID=1052259 RepID=A0ABU8EBT9_9ACTN|nr:hypothetical protein [Klenkia terrae]